MPSRGGGVTPSRRRHRRFSPCGKLSIEVRTNPISPSNRATWPMVRLDRGKVRRLDGSGRKRRIPGQGRRFGEPRAPRCGRQSRAKPAHRYNQFGRDKSRTWRRRWPPDRNAKSTNLPRAIRLARVPAALFDIDSAIGEERGRTATLSIIVLALAISLPSESFLRSSRIHVPDRQQVEPSPRNGEALIVVWTLIARSISKSASMR